MTFEKIKYFYDIVRCGSFTIAAQENYIAQATISQQISAMEQELGFKLLERTTRGIMLTEQGMSFYTDCQPILLAYTQAVNRARTKGGSVRAFFPLGVIEGLDVSRVYQAFCNVREQYPTGQCTIYCGSPAYCKKDFEVTSTAALLTMPYGFEETSPNEFITTPLFSCGYDFVVGKNHNLAGKAAVNIETIRKELFVVCGEAILGPKAYAHIVVEQMQIRHGINRIAIAPNYRTQELMVASGNECMLLPKCIKLSCPEMFKRIPIEDYHEVCDFALISRFGKSTSTFLQDFIKCLQTEYSNQT